MSENVKKVKEEKGEGVKKISEKNLALIITAGVLALIFIAAAVFSLIQAITSDAWFDYMKSDLTEYLEFPENHKDFKLNIDVAKPHDIDVDITILNLLYEDRKVNEKYGNNPITSPYTISAGDDVSIWYTGYLLDEDNNKVYLSNMSNFILSSPTTIGIGSNDFIPGFELNLIGKNTGDYSKFNRITTGRVTENLILYVSYTLPNATDSTKTDKYTTVRMDLSEDLDAQYGAGFEAALMELSVGGAKTSVKATLNDKEITYSDLTVDFAVDGNANPIVVECYFSYDYSKDTTLRNETAYFEVYVDSIVDYICPEFTDDYIREKFSSDDYTVTVEDLEKLEGDTLVEKYRNFAQKTLDDVYDNAYKSLVESAVWSHYKSTVKVKKYPQVKVDEMYDYYIDELTSAYISNGGMAYDSATGNYKTYDSLEAFIPAYLGLSSSQNWKSYITDMAKNAVKERMIMYYLLRYENLVPSGTEFNDRIGEIRQEYVDEYVAQYIKNEGKTKEDYTEEEYAKIVSDCTDEILSYYDDDYFTTRVYYIVVSEEFIKWPEVVTLDERRAYPFDK
jgi:FKBP-type peptidyl-prolyl cis-trans isomerase (trigger factor)